MSGITGSQAKSLVEAYQSIYNIEEQVVEDDLALEIFESIAYVLISQGHTAVDVLEYFSNVDDEVIIEDLIALSEGTFIVEEVVSEEYIEEQMQQLDEFLGAALRIGGAALKAAKFAPKGAGALSRVGSGLKAAGTATSRVAQQGTKASAVVRPALGRAAQAVKSAGANVASKVGGAVSKVKDVAKGALNKLPGGSGGKLASAAKTAGKWALGGAAFEGGMRAVQGLAGGGGGDKTSSAKPKPTVDKAKFTASKALGGKTAFQAGGGAAAMKKNPKLTAADVQKSGTAALRASAGGDLGKGAKLFKAKQEIMAGKPAAPKAAAPAPKPAPAPSPAPSGGGGGGGGRSSTPTAKPAPSGPKQTGDKAKDMATWAAANPELAKKVPPSKPSISKDVEELQQMQKRSKERQGATKTESYDVFDLVLEYLLETEQAETISEAQYIMTQMDEESINDIVEAKYGTAAGRKALAKKIRKGENIGKKGPGTGFESVEKAAEKGGAEDPKAVAAAAMWKTYGKGKK